MQDLNSIYARMGEIRVSALHLGGTELLDKIEIELGVAVRHTQRIRKGILPMVPMVMKEIDDCLDRAKILIETWKN